MRLFEIFSSEQAKCWWINPKTGRIITVDPSTTHSIWAKSNARDLGLSSDNMNAADEVGVGSAEYAIQHGWVRVSNDEDRLIVDGLTKEDVRKAVTIIHKERMASWDYLEIETMKPREHHRLGPKGTVLFLRNGEYPARSLIESEVPSTRTMFHVTRSRNRKSILNSGLEPRNVEFENAKRRPGIYLFETLEQARDWAFWCALDWQVPLDIWEVHIPDDYELTQETHPEIIDKYDAWICYQIINPLDLRLNFTQKTPKSSKDAPPFATKLR